MALVDGELGVAVAPAGTLLLMLRVEVRGGRIVGISAVADRHALEGIDVAVG